MGCENNECMRLSDSLPLQWWPINKPTFNQASPGYMNDACYNHAWKCSDKIRNQFLTDEDLELILKAIDENGSEVYSSVMQRKTFGNLLHSDNFDSDLSSWTQENYPGDVGSDWIVEDGKAKSVVASVASVPTNTKLLTIAKTIEAGKKYSLNVDFSAEDNSALIKALFLYLYVWQDGDIVDTIVVYTHPGETSDFLVSLKNFVFTPLASGNKFSIRVLTASAEDIYMDVELDNFKLSTFKTLVHEDEFIASSEGLCEKLLKFNLLGSVFPSLSSNVAVTRNYIGGNAWTLKRGGYLESFVTAGDIIFTQDYYAPVQNELGYIQGGTSVRVRARVQVPVDGNTYNLQIRIYDSNGDGIDVIVVKNPITEGGLIQIDEEVEIPTNTYFIGASIWSSGDVDAIGIRMYSFGVYDVIAHTDFNSFSDMLTNGVGIGSELIEYRGSHAYDGLIHGEGVDSFYFRVDCRFYHLDADITETEVDGDDSIILSSSTYLEKCLMTISDAPDYTHTKLTKILQLGVSGEVIIKDKYWVMADRYEREPRQEDVQLKPGKVTLTDRDSYLHNLI